MEISLASPPGNVFYLSNFSKEFSKSEKILKKNHLLFNDLFREYETQELACLIFSCTSNHSEVSNGVLYGINEFIENCRTLSLKRFELQINEFGKSFNLEKEIIRLIFEIIDSTNHYLKAKINGVLIELMIVLASVTVLILVCYIGLYINIRKANSNILSSIKFIDNLELLNPERKFKQTFKHY